ncbi:MAG TPA: SDR family oxidoreductase [Candidatus Hydrogenedentes bacterium]|nr:SDR family oxidoreductase [Candidatus Hydrogenedentota bacterium]
MTSAYPKSVVILGALSGVARYIADEFARRGFSLILAERDMAELELIAADMRVRHSIACYCLEFDALRYDDHAQFVRQCAETLGETPGGVVLCFGFMADQTQAQRDFSTARRTLEVNFIGAVSILEHFAAAFEERGNGFIAGLSSVAGDRGRKANYIYGAAKGGLSIYLQGLRNRLYASGVQVTTVKPGFMDTPMTYGMELPKPLVAAPDIAGRAIVRAILKGKNVIYVLFFWRYIMWIIKSIPEWQFKKMSI